MKRVAAVALLAVVAAAAAGALLISDDPAPAPEAVPHAYVPCQDTRGEEPVPGGSRTWHLRCIQIPHLGDQPGWDCKAAPEDFEEARVCVPWAEHHEALWTVTFLETHVTTCADAVPLAPGLAPLLGAPQGCLDLNATMLWHPGNEGCAGLKDSFPDAGGLYEQRFPTMFCFSVDYTAVAWSTDSAGNVTFTTELSPEQGELGHVDHAHMTTTCAWDDPSPAPGDEVACDVVDAARAQGTMWMPHPAAHMFEPGTGDNHQVLARLAVEAPGHADLVVEATATVDFFILGAG